MYPVKNHKVTCSYGVKGKWKCGYHCGVDLIPSMGDYNIYAPVESIVYKTVKNHSSYGNYVILKHNDSDGYMSRYAHLKEILVKNGDKVREGQVIGIMGSTGNSSGRHLHWEAHKGNSMAYPANTDPLKYIKEKTMAVYSYENKVHTVKIPVKEFKIEIWDKKKKTTAIKNYANAGFFGGFKEKGRYFTLPAAHLVCDCTYITELNMKYLPERGKIKGNKVYIDALRCPNGRPSPENAVFSGKKISSLIIEDGKARIERIKSIEEAPKAEYIISGIPVMRDGADVSFSKEVKAEGWTSGSLYATKHIFIGLKGDGYIYVMGYQSKTGNCVSSGEAYKLFKAKGFKDVIKLDGGGSAVIDVNGKNKFVTSENRQINNIVRW